MRSASMRSLMPSRRGTENPQISASSTPTVKPRAAERGGEVDRARALADAALAAGDREHLAVRGHGVGGRVLARVPARLAHHVGALVGVHLAPVDAHVRHARVEADAMSRPPLDVGPQRAAADRELDADRDDAVVAHGDGGNHAERHDVGAQLRVDHGAQHVLDLGLSGRGGTGNGHAPRLPARSRDERPSGPGHFHVSAPEYQGVLQTSTRLGSMTPL